MSDANKESLNNMTKDFLEFYYPRAVTDENSVYTFRLCYKVQDNGVERYYYSPSYYMDFASAPTDTLFP